MRKQERARLIQRRLAEHCPETPVPLHHSDPFTLAPAACSA
ncbi:MAG: endonuclease III, partial [Cyanobacteriota bacterium]|nr:endonuclease III [Cyanobacteriota bacterium]